MRRCSAGVSRSECVAKSWSHTAPGARRHTNEARSTTSPLVCSRERACRFSIWLPTMTGFFAARANALERRTESGSSAMSSSISRIWSTKPGLVCSIDSYSARVNPPAPPRLACSMTSSRPPSASCASPNRSCSRILRLPWSATNTLPITSSTAGSSPSAISDATQSSSRLNVVMPTATFCLGSGSSASHTASATSSVVVLGEHVEPDPAAVLERREVDAELERPPGLPGVHRLAGRRGRCRRWAWTGTPRPGPPPRTPQAQRDVLDAGPALPVAGREGVEVRRERHPRRRRHHHVAPAGDVAVRALRLVEVQRPHVQRVARPAAGSPAAARDRCRIAVRRPRSKHGKPCWAW